MAIYGFLTVGGERIMADKLLNNKPYTISSVTAGTGPTPQSATSLVGYQQTLTVGTVYTEGGVKIVPATLIMANANSDYDLAELAIYVTDSNGYSVLFKVFQVTPTIRITRGEPHTLQFLLKDTDITGARSGIVIAPDAAMTTKNYFDHLKTQSLAQCETVNISMDGIRVTSYLKNLPNYLDKHYEIKLTGNFSYSAMTIQDKYGPGSITIDGNAKPGTTYGEYTLQDSYILISNCNLSGVTIKNLRSNVSYGNYMSSHIYIQNAKNVTLERVRLEQSSARNLKIIGSQVSMVNCQLFQPNNTFEISLSQGASLRLNHLAASADGSNFTSNSQGVRFRIADWSSADFYGDIAQSTYSNFSFVVSTGRYSMKATPSDPTAITRIY